MHARHARALFALATIIALFALAGCARVAPTAGQPAPAAEAQPAAALRPAQPSPAQQEAPTMRPAPTEPPAPTTPPTAQPAPDEQGARDELETAMAVQTWIEAVETGNGDLARYVYGLEAGAPPSAILGHIEALRQFIAKGEDPEQADLGAYLGFYDIVGSYPTEDPGQRVAVAMMRFERAVICFRAELSRVELPQGDAAWSVERWEPVPWEQCGAELARTPEWVREEWRAAAPVTP